MLRNSKKLKAVLFWMLCFCATAISQTPEKTDPKVENKKTDWGLDGMIGISYSGTTLGINVGGPSLKYKFNKDWKAGVGAFPSLVVIDKKAFPKLGVSPILEYKKWLLIFPYYGYDASDKMIWTYGFGYKFY